MAYVKDNLGGGVQNGAAGVYHCTSSNITIDTGLSDVTQITWMGDSNIGVGGGYDFERSADAPNFNHNWFTTPVKSGGVVTFTSSLGVTGSDIYWYAVNAPLE